jgi:hypothetical protein
LRHAGERTIATFSLPIIPWIHSDYENALVFFWKQKCENSDGLALQLKLGAVLV